MAVAVRKIDPSRALKRMENGTKQYPKFVHQNGLAALNAKEEVTEPGRHHRDHAFTEQSGVRRRVTPGEVSTSSIAPMPDEVPTTPIPAPEAAPPPVDSIAPSSAPSPLMHLMSDSAFEQLLAAEPPEPIRSSVRPTVRLGSPAVLVMAPPEALGQRFGSLLTRPSDVRAHVLPPPQPLLPSVSKPRSSRWTAWAAAAGALIVAGTALFGGAHWVKTSSRRAEAPPVVVATVEAEHSSSEAPAPKKAALTGPAQARAALASGDVELAGRLFEELAENPSTRMDGLTGLAEVSRAHGDLAGARARYRDMLAESPQYFPAKLGEADTTWDLGEKDSARRQYAALETDHPSRTLPSRVHDRAGKNR